MKIKYILTAGLLLVSSIAAAGKCGSVSCSSYVEFADEIITFDSRSWFFNRYDRGSAKLNNFWQSPSKMKQKVKVDYTFNGGARGWAELRFNDGEFNCIRYHDFPNDCRSRTKY